MRHAQRTESPAQLLSEAETAMVRSSAAGRDTRVLKLKQVTAIVGLGKSSIYRKVQEGTFPSPIKLGCERASGWISTEVFDWIDEQVRRSRENTRKRRL